MGSSDSAHAYRPGSVFILGATNPQSSQMAELSFGPGELFAFANSPPVPLSSRPLRVLHEIGCPEPLRLDCTSDSAGM